MIRTTHARMTAVLGAAVLLVLGPFFLSQGAEGGIVSEVAPDGIVVVGDSITARYDDVPGSERQGWWSMVARHVDAPVETYAQSGSGYLRRGGLCNGTTFDQREKALEGSPSILIIEGGRNDWAVCRDDRVAVASNARDRRCRGRLLRPGGRRAARVDPSAGARTSMGAAAADRAARG